MGETHRDAALSPSYSETCRPCKPEVSPLSVGGFAPQQVQRSLSEHRETDLELACLQRRDREGDIHDAMFAEERVKASGYNATHMLPCKVMAGQVVQM